MQRRPAHMRLGPACVLACGMACAGHCQVAASCMRGTIHTRITNFTTQFQRASFCCFQTQLQHTPAPRQLPQVRDLLPDYGAGFVAACLEAYGDNTETVRV